MDFLRFIFYFDNKQRRGASIFQDRYSHHQLLDIITFFISIVTKYGTKKINYFSNAK